MWYRQTGVLQDAMIFSAFLGLPRKQFDEVLARSTSHHQQAGSDSMVLARKLSDPGGPR